ncbi:MAG: hypothetical protein ACRD4D_09565 [Candidatus Acidiferrales bacterium]
MSRHRHALLLSLFVGLVFSPETRAQADYRNLDPGRPIAIEDAQPVEFRAFEVQFGVPRFVRERRGDWELGFEPEFKVGLARDWQFGLSSEFVVARAKDNTVSTFRDTQLHLLYNFNQESRQWPAFALRPELTIRSGALGSRHEHGSLKAIVSKTFHRNRVHFNGSYTVGPTEEAGRGGELVNRFLYGAAYERTFPLHFVVLLADVYARKPIDNRPTEVVFEAGARVQVNPQWVVDAGVSSGVLRDSAGPDIGFTFGVSYSFSFRSLFPTGASKGRE